MLLSCSRKSLVNDRGINEKVFFSTVADNNSNENYIRLHKLIEQGNTIILDGEFNISKPKGSPTLVIYNDVKIEGIDGSIGKLNVVGDNTSIHSPYFLAKQGFNIHLNNIIV